jgi:hypothetical protein
MVESWRLIYNALKYCSQFDLKSDTIELDVNINDNNKLYLGLHNILQLFYFLAKEHHTSIEGISQ